MCDEIALLLLWSQLGIGISHRLLVLDFGSFVAHSEQWSLKHIHVALLDEVREELQEEGDDEQSDVHSIYIGIGSHNHLIISQSVQSVLDIEGCLEQVELLVLVNHLLGQTIAV